MILTYGYSYALHGIGNGAARAWFSGEVEVTPALIHSPRLRRTMNVEDRLRRHTSTEDRIRRATEQ